MNFYVLLLAAALNPGVASAKESPSTLFAHPVDESDPDLRAVQDRLAAVIHVRSEFTQTKRMKALARPLESRGTVLVADDLGVVWQVEHPVTSSVVISSAGMVHVDEAGRKRTMKPSRKPILFRVMTAFVAVLRGDTASIAREFELYFATTDTGWEIGLTPKQRLVKRAIRDITLRGSETIDQIRIREPNGDSTVIDLSSIDTNHELTPDERRLFPR